MTNVVSNADIPAGIQNYSVLQPGKSQRINSRLYATALRYCVLVNQFRKYQKSFDFLGDGGYTRHKSPLRVIQSYFYPKQCDTRCWSPQVGYLHFHVVWCAPSKERRACHEFTCGSSFFFGFLFFLSSFCFSFSFLSIFFVFSWGLLFLFLVVKQRNALFKRNKGEELYLIAYKELQSLYGRYRYRMYIKWAKSNVIHASWLYVSLSHYTHGYTCIRIYIQSSSVQRLPNSMDPIIKSTQTSTQLVFFLKLIFRDGGVENKGQLVSFYTGPFCRSLTNSVPACKQRQYDKHQNNSYFST